jgi:arylsulfatase A-like enzyme
MNVLFLVGDALRKDRVGALNGRNLTPNIDSFAADAVRFNSAFTTANATDPAITSIQTGRYPVSHGVLHHGPNVKGEEKAAVESIPQLPDVLSEAGYRTAKIGRPLGRWHRSGFDVYPEEMEGYTPKDKTGLNRLKYDVSMFLSQVHPKLRDTVSNVYNSVASLASNKTDDTDKTIEAFRSFLHGVTDKWFAFVHLMDTHTPYNASSEAVKENLQQFSYRPRPLGGRNKTPPDFHERVRTGDFSGIEERFYYGAEPSSAVVEAHYDACVSETDRRIGKMIDTLKSVGEIEDTLIIFMSDHGESIFEKGIIQYHHGLYENLVNIPLIIRPPGGLSGGRDIDQLVSIVDIAPTVVEYVGADGLQPDGRSVRGLIEGNGSFTREFVMAEDVHQRRRMIRDTHQKYIKVFEGSAICPKCNVEHANKEEYYNLRVDPTEEYNDFTNSKDSVTELSAEMERRITEFKNRINAEGESVDYEDGEVVRKRMEALGYK